MKVHLFTQLIIFSHTNQLQCFITLYLTLLCARVLSKEFYCTWFIFLNQIIQFMRVSLGHNICSVE